MKKFQNLFYAIFCLGFCAPASAVCNKALQESSTCTSLYNFWKGYVQKFQTLNQGPLSHNDLGEILSNSKKVRRLQSMNHMTIDGEKYVCLIYTYPQYPSECVGMHDVIVVPLRVLISAPLKRATIPAAAVGSVRSEAKNDTICEETYYLNIRRKEFIVNARSRLLTPQAFQDFVEKNPRALSQIQQHITTHGFAHIELDRLGRIYCNNKLVK